MHSIFFITSLLLALESMALAVDAPEQIRQSPTATLRVDVSEYQVAKHSTLGDVASCQGDAALCEKLLAYNLMSFEPEGMDRLSLSQTTIVERIRKDNPESEVEVEPFGNLSLQFHRKELTEDDLLRNLQNLCDAFNMQNSDVNLEPVQVQMLQRTKLTDGIVKVQFPELEQRFSSDFAIDLKPFRTPMHLTAVITIDDERGSQVRWSLMARFSTRLRMTVFKKSVAAGDVITADDLQDAWKSLDEVGFQSVAPKEDIIGKSSRLSQHAGDIPRSAQFYKPILVKFGEDVDVAIANQDMRVVTKGRSIGQGGLGDRIGILISGGKKKVFAKIIATGKAEVLSE